MKWQECKTGQRVATPRSNGQWVGTVIHPTWVNIAGQAAMALVEWTEGTGNHWATWGGKHRQIHPHAELTAVENN